MVKKQQIMTGTHVDAKTTPGYLCHVLFLLENATIDLKPPALCTNTPTAFGWRLWDLWPRDTGKGYERSGQQIYSGERWLPTLLIPSFHVVITEAKMPTRPKFDVGEPRELPKGPGSGMATFWAWVLKLDKLMDGQNQWLRIDVRFRLTIFILFSVWLN